MSRGDVTLTSSGQVALSGAALDVMLAVDFTVQRWATEAGAEAHRYPSLISADVLKRAGREEWTAAEAPRRASARNDQAALAPAVCYHAYPEYQDRTLLCRERRGEAGETGVDAHDQCSARLRCLKASSTAAV